ncbi:laforin-like [Branchiostoma floridae x Branchiostoma japonicum]
MKIRFGLAAFIEEGYSVAVVGSLSALGSWNPDGSLPLHPVIPPKAKEPSFWTCDVDLFGEGLPDRFQYKFIRQGPVGKGSDEKGEEDVVPQWEWEGCGEGHNRTWEYQQDNILGGVHCNPVARWQDKAGETSEFDLTTRFFFYLSDNQLFHYSEILDNVWLGSCPRTAEHITKDMKQVMGTTAVMNFQMDYDLWNNSADCCPQGADVPRYIYEVYRQNGISYVWMPTADMSTEGRIKLLPQAVYVLHGLLRSGHNVYVHCNAGIGRSVAVVCGYLMYVLGWSFRKMQYYLCSRRPVSYIDEVALNAAEKDFAAKFGRLPVEY